MSTSLFYLSASQVPARQLVLFPILFVTTCSISFMHRFAALDSDACKHMELCAKLSDTSSWNSLGYIPIRPREQLHTKLTRIKVSRNSLSLAPPAPPVVPVTCFIQCSVLRFIADRQEIIALCGSINVVLALPVLEQGT